MVHNTNCLVDKIKNNFTSLHNKFSSHTDGLKAKFLKDFPDDDAILGVLNQGKAFEAWKKLSEITGTTKIWISKSKAILERVNTKNLSDADIEKLKNYYNGHLSPDECKIYPSKSNNGIDFDEFGHPEFNKPEFTPGKDYFVKRESDFVGENPNPGPRNPHPDFVLANAELASKFEIKVTNETGSPILIKINGEWKGPYTWHHHQDGKTLMPVLQTVHQSVRHIGGASSILKGIRGFFESPF